MIAPFNRWPRWILVGLCVLMSTPQLTPTQAREPQVLAAPIQPVGDTHLTERPFLPSPDDVVALTPALSVFTALTQTGGRELWTTDGTVNGATSQDLLPGPASSDPRFLHALDGEAWFWAYRTVDGPRELWRSDGTAAGTSVFAPAGPDTVPGELAKADQRLFFVKDGPAGAELWRSDGTPAGTVMVADLNPGPAGSDPRQLVAAGGWAYFNAFDGTRWSIWRANRSGAPVQVLADVQVTQQLAVGADLYLVGSQPGHPCGLWKVTGASGTAALVADVCPTTMVAAAGQLVFVADETQLWRTSGAAPQFVWELAPYPRPITTLLAGNAHFGFNTVFVAGNMPSPNHINLDTGQAKDLHFMSNNIVLTDDRLISVGDTAPDAQPTLEILSYDGTDMHWDWLPSPYLTGQFRMWSSPPSFSACEADLFYIPSLSLAPHQGGCTPLFSLDKENLGYLMPQEREYVSAQQPATANQLDNGWLVMRDKFNSVAGYAPDGSAVTELASGYPYMTTWINLGSRILFEDDQSLVGTDGATRETLPISSSSFSSYINSDQTAYIRSYEGNYWHTDGTVAGTQLIRTAMPFNFGPVSNDRVLSFEMPGFTGTINLWDLETGQAITTIPTPVAWWYNDPTTLVDGIVYRFGWSSGRNGQLWRSDWTAAGTQLIWESNAVSKAVMLPSLTADRSHFVALNPVAHQLELWSTDSLTSTLVMTRTLAPDQAYLSNAALIAPGSAYIGTTSAAQQVSQIWAVQPNGLQPVGEIPGVVSDPPGPLLAGGRTLIESTIDWRPILSVTDGTPAGTHTLVPASHHPASIYHELLHVSSDHVVFKTYTLTGPDKLWLYDAVSDSTTLLESEIAGTTFALAGVLDGMPLVAKTTPSGAVLWRINLAQANTTLLHSFARIDAQTSAVMDDTLLISADDGTHGLELWRSDGTAAGTQLFQDINPGPGSSFPTYLTVMDDHAYVAAINAPRLRAMAH